MAKDMGYTNIVTFVDDGVSGVTMDRPGFNEMMRQLEEGKASALFVKDLSRLGRNYIEVGRLMEEFFPEHDIRLVAVSDNIDTAEGENELAPIRNLFNEWYARDISKKRRISNKIKGNAGEPMGQPPYGYIKDPENPKHWIIEEEAASVQVVPTIRTDQQAAENVSFAVFWLALTDFAAFLLNLLPNGTLDNRLMHILENHPVLTVIINPLFILVRLGVGFEIEDIPAILLYRKHLDNGGFIPLGGMLKISFARAVDTTLVPIGPWGKGSVPFKLSGNLLRSHTVQRHAIHTTDNYHFNQGNHDIKYFNCSNYKGNRGTCTSTHYIRVDFLEQVVLGEIKRLTKYAVHYEDEFLQAVMGSTQKTAESEHKRKQKELAAMQARDSELDGLFERIYEDNLSGKLSDERFAKMSQRYEAEQAELAEKMRTLRKEIEKLNSESVSTDMFLSTVRKYTRAKKLTPRMLNELIQRIEVHQAERIDGEWVQKLTIYYNCIGALFIPDTDTLPTPDVTVNTRKGVFVTYEPAQNEQ